MARSSIMMVRPRAVLTRQQYDETLVSPDVPLFEVAPEWARCIHGHDRLNRHDVQALSRDNNNVVGEAHGWSAEYASGADRCGDCIGFARSMCVAAQRFGIERVRPISAEFAGHFLAEHAAVAEAVAARRRMLV